MNSAVRRTPLVPRVDRAAPLRFLRTAYEADDWIPCSSGATTPARRSNASVP